MIEVCNKQVMQPLLARYGFHFSKAKGQNFLAAPWVVERIADEAGIDGETGVLEVGPGIGALTQQLCLRAGKVCAVELDRRLEDILALTTGDFSNLSIVWGDVLRQDVPALVRDALGTRRTVACANLPYYITSPVLAALLASRCFDAVTVMVQKEVAERIAARPGTAQYGAFSVMCQYYAAAEVCFEVPAACFVPQPKVVSAVVRLTPYAQSPWAVADEAMFFRTVRASFAMRRKKLANGLAAAFPQLGKAGAAEVIARCGLDENVRGETLDIPTFAALAQAIAERSAHD